METKAIFVTVNTDAGFFSFDRVGSYAYWIRGHGITLKGSGMLKHKCESPWHAEMKAMINALYAIRANGHPPIIGFIFNRDNINAISGSKGHELKKRLKSEISYFKIDAIARMGKQQFQNITKTQKEYAIFRHVKAHSDVQDKRSYVNRWCDSECRRRLAEWNSKRKQNNFESK